MPQAWSKRVFSLGVSSEQWTRHYGEGSNDVKTDWSVSFSDRTGPWREMQQRKEQGRTRLTFWVWCVCNMWVLWVQSTGRQLEAAELLRLCMCPQRRLWVSLFVVLPHLFPSVLPDHIRVLALLLLWAADKALWPLSEKHFVGMCMWWWGSNPGPCHILGKYCVTEQGL